MFVTLSFIAHIDLFLSAVKMSISHKFLKSEKEMLKWKFLLSISSFDFSMELRNFLQLKNFSHFFFGKYVSGLCVRVQHSISSLKNSRQKLSNYWKSFVVSIYNVFNFLYQSRIFFCVILLLRMDKNNQQQNISFTNWSSWSLRSLLQRITWKK